MSSEAKCPVMHGTTNVGMKVEQRSVAEPAEPQDSPPELAAVRSDGQGL